MPSLTRSGMLAWSLTVALGLSGCQQASNMLGHQVGRQAAATVAETLAPIATQEAAPAAQGDVSACASQLPNGQVPRFDNPNMITRTTLLCRPRMAILASGVTRTGLWSAEYMDPARVASAKTMHRSNTFHAEANLPPADRAELSDYVHSGYDRGHLSPSADQPTADTQNDSFTLANMAPQNAGLNRGPWERLEVAVRWYAQRSPVYVITGVQFDGSQISFLKGRVAIPTSDYKLIYDPAQQAAVVYEAPNVDQGQPIAMSVDAFEQQSGIHFGLGPVRALTLDLPSR